MSEINVTLSLVDFKELEAYKKAITEKYDAFEIKTEFDYWGGMQKIIYVLKENEVLRRITLDKNDQIAKLESLLMES